MHDHSGANSRIQLSGRWEHPRSPSCQALCPRGVHVVHQSSPPASLLAPHARARVREEREAPAKQEWPLKEKRGGRKTQLNCTFTDENFMTLNLDRLLVSVRITAAARTVMNY